MSLVPASTSPSSYGPSPALPPKEALAPPRPPDEVPKGTNLMGVLLLVMADAMVLATLLAAWLTVKSGSLSWPPKGVHLTTYLPSVITITAVMSSFSMQWAVSSIRRNDQRSATTGIILTAFFGICIVNAQWYSLVRAKFGIASHAYGTLYDLLIGYHAVHQALAVGALVLVGARAVVGHFGREGYDPMRAVAAFWHYSNAAWFLIMTAIFLFSRHG
jgi:heme/copper-type cytochrome/quinol oxidase subunit 3